MDKKISRRALLKTIGGTFLFSIDSISSSKTTQSASFIAVRIWPALSYTRITVESESSLDYKYFHLEKPERLVLDIQNARLDTIIKSISSKVLERDPYVEKARVGQYDEYTVRVVLDLKVKVNPQIFTLKPVAKFKNRLVIDLYPSSVSSDDPLLGLLQEYNKGQVASDGTTSLNPLIAGQDQGVRKDVLGDKIHEILIDKKQKDQFSVLSESHTIKSYVDTNKIISIHRKEVKSTENFNKRPQKIDNIKDIVIVLDPGHGGEDPGAIGPLGTREKDVVLNIARKTREELRKKGFKRVYMTRDEDVFIPLRVRVAKARQLKAHVFVSIHADAFTNPSARGTGVYALSQKGATSEAARYLAKTQNQSDEIGGVKTVGDKNIDNTLFDLTQTATINRGLKLGDHVLRELEKINKLHKTTVNQANFAVLKAPDIPSILVESAFISNPTEENLLRTNNFKLKIAQSISEGVLKFTKTII